MKKRKYIYIFIFYRKIFSIFVSIDFICLKGYTIQLLNCFVLYKKIKIKIVFFTTRFQKSISTLTCIAMYFYLFVSSFFFHHTLLRCATCTLLLTPIPFYYYFFINKIALWEQQTQQQGLLLRRQQQ